jgi:hypothetical protein
VGAVRRSLFHVSLALSVALLCVAAAAQQPETGDPAESRKPVPPPPEVVEQLHDVRPPVAFEPTWRPIDYAVAIGGALILAAAALLAWRARRAAAPEPPAAPPSPPPHIAALDALDALRARRLYESGSEGHLMLAQGLPAILKAYLDAIQRAQFTYWTTRETHGRLAGQVPHRLAEEATWLLIECDRVKFAGQSGFADDPIDRAEAVIRGLVRWQQEEAGP